MAACERPSAAVVSALAAAVARVALHKLAQEDPTFRVHTDEDSSQTIISGMGELHLEIIVDRMMREFNVAANVGRPATSSYRIAPQL